MNFINNYFKKTRIKLYDVEKTKAKKILNWKPNISLRKGLALTAYKKIYVNFK